MAARFRELVPDVSVYESRRLDLRAGDLALYSATMLFHRVTRASGTRTRYSFAGTFALSVDGQRGHFWS